MNDPRASYHKGQWARGPLIILIAFLPVMAIASMTASMPVMLDHFSGQSGARILVPLLVTAPGLMIALLATLAGSLVDRVGRRKPLIAACLLYGIAGCAPLLLENLYLIIASRLVLGIAEAALITISATLIADYWDASGRRFWLTMQGVTSPFLSSALIGVSGYLAAWHWNSVFLLYLIAFPLALACWKFVHDDPGLGQKHPTPSGERSSWLRPVLPVLAITLLASTLYYVWIVQGGLAFREVGVNSPARQGEIFALAHLAVIAGAGLFWVCARLLPSSGQAAVMLAVMGAGLLLIGNSSGERDVIIGLVVQQMAAGMAVLTLMNWAQTVLPADVRGAGLGAWSACFFIGQFFSPLSFAALSFIDESVLARFAFAGLFGLGAAALLGLLTFLRPGKDIGWAT